MNRWVLVVVAVVSLAPTAEAGTVGGLRAIQNVPDAVMLSGGELSAIEAGVVLYGAVQVPVYADSLSTFMSEVLATLLKLEGRSPIETRTLPYPIFAPLPTGGITVQVHLGTKIDKFWLSVVGIMMDG